MAPFSVSRLPHLHFGQSELRKLPAVLDYHGVRRMALVTGGRSFLESEQWAGLRVSLSDARIDVEHFSVAGEPSPLMVDEFKRKLAGAQIEAVVSIGGGSAIDAGKALSAALHLPGSIRDYLEGVGSSVPTGAKTFFVAVPTTSGTGTEATKNAVLSEIGEHGFKKSLRHDNYVPDVAIVDPSLAVSCPPAVTSRSGMDAITQLLEAYVSTESNSFTDALAESGLAAAGRSFLAVCRDGDDLAARADMAYASYLSGVCLANAGLGVVHGIASVAGARTTIPHGVVCGTLLACATRYTIEKLGAGSGMRESEAIRKYARAAVLLSGEDAKETEANLRRLVDRLVEYQVRAQIPLLGDYGFSEADLKAMAARAGVKNHPVALSADEICAIMKERM